MVCVRVENCKTELDFANFEAELSGATAVLSGYGEDNASVPDLFMKLAVGVSRRRFEKEIVCKHTFLQVIRKVPRRPHARYRRGGWHFREEKEEVTNRDQLLVLHSWH